MTSDNGSAPASARVPFRLTLRQRRLRTATAVILGVIALMIVFGNAHPFFHPHPPAALTPHLRRLFGVRMLLILSYWTVCLLFTVGLVVLAWLDVREIRLHMMMARRDIWRELADRQRSRQRNPPAG
jgi:hypothetical protein